MEKVKFIKQKCLRCGHTWLPRVSIPLSCPNCKNRLWDVPKDLPKVEDK